MAAKSKGKQRGEDLKQEDVFQAVVIADSFNIRFAPITKEKPKSLLPVANLPILDYTLEFLVSAGVQEIYVFCCHLADQIRTHLRQSKWSECSSCSITPVLSECCMSMGDALREIHDKSVIRSDFVLVYGDVVANIRLQDVLEEHKKRREDKTDPKNRNSVMTMIFQKVPPGHRSRNKEDDIFLAIDQSSSRVLHYQRVTEQSKLHIPVEVLTDNDNVQLRYDLLDSQISVCSPEVLSLYKDNFDYLNRDDFVKGILINEDIMEKTMHVCVINDGYMGRISNLQMYDAVSHDVICRWSYPLVPDTQTDEQGQVISHSRHNIYTSKDVTLAKGCVLEKNVLVGRGTRIGSDTKITDSVIGKDCKIGSNVTIENAYIWDGVTIEDNCCVNTSIVCDNVVIYSSTSVQPGCILSMNVEVGPSIRIESGTRLQSSKDEDDDFGDDLTEADQDAVSIMNYGSKSQAFLYQPPEDSDEEDNDIVQDMWGLSIQSESSTETSSLSKQSSVDEAMLDDEELFYSELLDTLVKAKEDNYTTENLILEINSLKHTYNIAITDLYGMVMKGLIEIPLRESQDLDPGAQLVSVKKNFVKYSSLIKNYIKGEESQLDCLHALEDFALSNSKVNTLLVKILHTLYDLDILSEQVLIKWHNLDKEEEYKAIKHQVAPLIKWLEEAEEETSDEEEGSD
ncbi:translation initiation factor eIF-2B subunit epsilon-like [Saccostrea cucullata]|uniref:translation initiation factor eIF-2B subunit epsilon-like n=1 Tax=Saccostrea cuccullata TaxID=36930 RepID=UPI002ED1F22B